MPAWIVITIAAAFLQNIRSALQKHLKGRIGTTGATFIRFGFGVPFALIYLAILASREGHVLPALTPAFAGWALVGAFTQIAAQFLLVHLFAFRNFAVGTAYSRTEPAQAALFALVFLGETVTVSTLTAIAISVAGVMLISVARTALSVRSLLTSVTSRTALIGLLSGTFFGIAAVSYRSASLALGRTLPAPDYAMQASVTLAVVIVVQTVAMLAWMLWREPKELGQVMRAWRPAILVGFVGATASFGWFSAMTLQQAAVVKALAQIEMLFTFASSVFIFKEKINGLEIAGCLLIVFGILALLLF